MSIISYIKEVASETRNIKWPTRKQVISYTLIVIVLSLLLAAYVGALDAAFAKLLSIILN
ncbi:preprotein translocase subunit SecE, partial [Candidatus Parcubacteria bacterium]|nr:preprotein translocase subunit SecE [Candidatus Parcubacteria bacterium]